MVRPSPKAVKSRSRLNLVITRLLGCRDLANQCALPNEPDQGAIMAKRKKGSKVQSRAKVRRANSAKRGKARKAAKAAKRTVAKAKPKRAPVKKAARKVKQPAVPEVEETEIRKAS